jgi:Uma2 family endonuclease
MTATVSSRTFVPPRQFENGAEWHASLGNVPLERIVFDPWPGTATEANLLLYAERDKYLCELIDGTLVQKTWNFWDGVITCHAMGAVGIFAHEHDLGIAVAGNGTLRMKSGHVRLPDGTFISRNRVPKGLDPIPAVAPDLAIEVLNEGNTALEMELKLIDYFESGTRLAWFIDPGSRTVAVYHQPGKPTTLLNEQSTLDGEQVLPGLTITIADLFRTVPRGE